MNTFIQSFDSPLGPILLAADAQGILGVWFEGQTFFAAGLPSGAHACETPLLTQAKQWLNRYFSGKNPAFCPPLHPLGSPFQQEVWALLRLIPYGQTVTYGALAAVLAARRHVPRFSAQAVGGAVGRNPISLLIPCHRVIGANGALTGYAGGLERKRRLLQLEGILPPNA